MEYATEGLSEDDPLSEYGGLSIAKIGGYSDYFGTGKPDCPGQHLFTLATVWTSFGLPLPFLNRADPIERTEGTLPSWDETVYMPGDLGETYFFLDGKDLHVASRCY